MKSSQLSGFGILYPLQALVLILRSAGASLGSVHLSSRKVKPESGLSYVWYGIWDTGVCERKPG